MLCYWTRRWQQLEQRPVFELCDEPRTDLGLCFSPVFVCVSAGTGPAAAHLCVLHYLCVLRSLSPHTACQPNPTIIPYSSTHPLHLHPNPVIPRSVPPLSIYLRVQWCAVCIHLTPRSPWVSPFFPSKHLQSLLWPSLPIPPDTVLARLSRCLKAWHQGFFSAGFSPSRMKMRRKELHSAN